MERRWFHKPHVHTPVPGHERKVGWLELFYDLIYVATIIQLGTGLSKDPSFFGFFAFAALFAPLWYTWTGFTFFNNRFIVDDVLHRVMVLTQMFFVGVIAVFIPEVLKGDPTGFILGYVGARSIVVLLYLRAWLQADAGQDFSKAFSIGFAVGALVWASSIFVPTPWTYLVWAVAFLIDLGIPLRGKIRELSGEYPPDTGHMSERYGLLVIIVLGESFVKILTAVAEAGPSMEIGVMWAMTLMITASIWWIYFDDVAGSQIKEKVRGSRFIWVYGHLPLTIAITAVGVANKKVAFFDPFEPAPSKYMAVLCGTLGLVFLSVAMIDHVTERRHSNVSDRSRVFVRLGSALAILLIGAVANNISMDAIYFVGIIAAFCLSQVIFDLFVAPEMLEEHEHHHHSEGEEHPDHAPRPDQPGKLPRRDVSEAVRLGAPNELRRDLYFQFMESSWTATLIALTVIFIFTNVIFAAIYCLDPTGVTGVRPGAFIDAFFFSVQTLTTIGYGTMSPISEFAHTVVVVESAVGIIGVAICTGVFFAKASRPTESVLFSRPMVITQHDGKPTLLFRVGNARGNEVVEASMRCSALVATVTPEGHRYRRLFDLKLVREMTPVFTLSWTVMHIIDEDSPLYGMTNENIETELFAIICTMMGYDATYGQHTHARHLYYPEHVYFDRSFVDVISNLEDGRLQIDYRDFHKTKASVIADIEDENYVEEEE